MNDYYTTFASRFGKTVILWKMKRDVPKIYRIDINVRDRASTREIRRGHAEKSCGPIDDTIGAMLSYFSGGNVTFSLDLLDLDLCRKFQRKVLLADHAIPRGRVSTYGRLAARAGNPKGARAAGNVMAGNPFPILIPCHRVIRSDGSLGGYGGGLVMKRQLLEIEGITFDNRQKVPFKHFY